LPARRRSTARPTRATASDASDAPKSVELEARIGRLEYLVNGLREELAIRQRREAALQAELDHLWARVKQQGPDF
jgi:uncharacterized coiled-coil protein SlyX